MLNKINFPFGMHWEMLVTKGAAKKTLRLNS